MHYNKIITLKNSALCTLRNADFADGYPDENTFTANDEAMYLKEKSDSQDEIEILAEIDGKVVGTAGISKIGKHAKVKHRAEFGIGIDQKYWGLGIGKALTAACIECARKAGYRQLELECVAENQKALNLYRSLGFIEFGRNPMGFNSRNKGFQELVMMRLPL